METTTSLRCAENIALFHLLHAGRGRDGALWRDSVPALPSVDPVEALPTHREDYILSFERERSLASALAFISHIEDDPDYIPAVCVQEDHYPRDKPTLRILLAVNKCKSTDGAQMLERIKTGFERIFSELSRVNDDKDEDELEVEHTIRHLVVSMCSKRILSRLRLTTSERREARQHPKLRFQNVIHALPVHGNATAASSKHAVPSNEDRTLFVERLNEVVTLINAYSNHPRPKQLEDLVDEFYRLRQLDCQTMLSTIPDVMIEKSNKKSTLNMIHKVARYAEAARFLFRTSKRFPIARRMQAVIIGLPDYAFARAPLDSQYRLGISSILSRVKVPTRRKRMKQKSQTDTLCRLLGTTPSQADTDLTKQARRTHNTGKVHAEVQLVLHYETLERSKPSGDTVILPRIVSSSKKACFLCDLLIKMQGKMRTPWSHGKLYPGWLVPECPGLDLQKRFNAFLEDRIRMSVALLFQRGGKTSYPGPSESTLITLPSLESEPIRVFEPVDDGKIKFSETGDGCTGTMSQNGIDAAEPDKADSESDSGSFLSETDLESDNVTGSDAANERIASNSQSQNVPTDLSCKMEQTMDGGSQQAERVSEGHPSYGQLGNEAESAQAHPSPRSSDNNGDVGHHDRAAEDEHGSKISNEAMGAPQPGEQSVQSPKSSMDAVNSLEEYYHMRQGQNISRTIQPDHMNTFFTKSLVVEVEYSNGSSVEAAEGQQPHSLPFSIERLGVAEAERLKADGTIPIGNVEAVIGEVPIALPSMDHVYVAASGVVFRITFL